ncbi:hypothetical protein [Erwinia phage Virsaitis27]|nr:hypothetical protein [Erwinia phage Virsaitis27]
MIIKTDKELRKYVLNTLRDILRGDMAKYVKIEYPFDANMDTVFRPVTPTAMTFIGASFVNKVAEDFPVIHPFKAKIKFHSMSLNAEDFYIALRRSRAAGAIKAQAKLKEMPLEDITSSGYYVRNTGTVDHSMSFAAKVRTNLALKLDWVLTQGAKLLPGDLRQKYHYSQNGNRPGSKITSVTLTTVDNEVIRVHIQARSPVLETDFNLTRIRDRFKEQLNAAFNQMDFIADVEMKTISSSQAEFILRPNHKAKGLHVKESVYENLPKTSYLVPLTKMQTFEPLETKIEIHHANQLRDSIHVIDAQLEANGAERIEIEKRLQALAKQDVNLMTQRDVLKKAIEVLIG